VHSVISDGIRGMEWKYQTAVGQWGISGEACISVHVAKR